MENLLNLAGKNAFVTGASSGLGAHFAKILARAGANVVIAARRRESLDAVAADIAAAVGACRAIALDISSADRSEEHTSELQSLMRNSYAVLCLKKKNKTPRKNIATH